MQSYIPPPYSTLEGGSVLGGGAVIVVVCDKCDCERKVNLRKLSLRCRSLQSSSCYEQKASMSMMTINQGVRVLHVERECKYIFKESELKLESA